MATSQTFSIRARTRELLVIWAAAFVAALAATPAEAGFAVALRNNSLTVFDTEVPAQVFGALLTISNLQPGETAIALDFRPATGQLYVLGDSNRLYVVDVLTAIATPVSATPFTPGLSGTRFGFDFNPTVDRIRIVSDTGQNLRVHPDTGVVVGIDTPLNPGTPHVVGAAYTNNVPAAPTTTLYGIDSATDQLVLQNPPNNGSVTVVGPLGVNTTDDVGFDVAANTNVAYATLTVGISTGFYTINLTTGVATLVGTISGGPYADMAVLARGVPMVALRGGTALVRFHSATPGTLLGTATITGLQPGETIQGIDRRPANGQLYGLGSSGRLYLLNAFTGAATQIGGAFGMPAGTRFGVDFIANTGGLDVLTDAEEALRIDPDTAATTASAPFPPGNVVGLAWGNVDLPLWRILYLDSASDQVLRPNSNGPSFAFDVVGPLGVDTSGDVGFDISPLDNVAFASLTVGGVSGLYMISGSTGAARLIGTIGSGTPVNGLAAMPLEYQLAEGSTGAFFDTDILLVNPTASSVPVTITYLTSLAKVVNSTLLLAPQSRTTVSADANALLGETAFSTVVASPLGVAIPVERTMRWDATGYGMHTEKAADALATTWFFAEGSQGFFQTYFLLANPTRVSNSATMRFQLENGTTVTRTYPISAQSRLTVYAGDIPELVNQSFGTAVSFNNPAAAERAMYFGTPVFNGGHESAGVPRLANDWFLAEGATGGFFTTFVLLANPGVAAANVTMTYLREGGGTVTRTKTLPAGTRLTINVATEDATLAATSVATRVTADRPIVVERAMYWPMSGASWNEASNAFGVTQTALKWGLAEGRVGGPNAFQTYILVANPGTTVANLSLTILRTTGAPIVKTLAVPAGARLTITTGPGSAVPELADESFGATIVVGPAGLRRARDVLERERRLLGGGQRRDGDAPAVDTGRVQAAASRRAVAGFEYPPSWSDQGGPWHPYRSV